MPRNKQAELRKEVNERKAKKAVNPSTDLVDVVNNKDTNSKAKKEEKRSRRFCLVTYIDRDELERFVRRCDWIQHWALCTHDRDLTSEGEPKQLHTHLLLYTYNAKTASAIKKVFDRYSAEFYGTENAQNTLCQIMHDSGYQWRYLIHKDDKDKYQYSEELRKCDDFAYWHKLDITEGMTDSNTNYGMAILEDVLSGVSSLDLCRRYGKEYIYHATHYKNVAYDVTFEHNRSTFQGMIDMCNFALADGHYSNVQICLFLEMLAYCQAKFRDEQLREDVSRYLKS